MPKRVGKQISFTEKDKDALEHLMRQDNASRYVIRLIRQDMERQDPLRETIEGIVREILEKQGREAHTPAVNISAIRDLLEFK
jgi:translation elongation factor EF-Tu-like GTPase